jgi:uncharacterized protein
MTLILPSLNQTYRVLERYITDSRILKHCKATQEKAIHIARKVSKTLNVNVNLVSVGALLHDIGRARVHDITHGFVGGQILQSEGFPMQVVRVVERHVLGGFTSAEAKYIGLPTRSFLPSTWEEKIVCVADKLGLYQWNDIDFPEKWLGELRMRFSKLRRIYGGGEPFESSMLRAEKYVKALIRRIS